MYAEHKSYLMWKTYSITEVKGLNDANPIWTLQYVKINTQLSKAHTVERNSAVLFIESLR